jgi:hypothetical protein
MRTQDNLGKYMKELPMEEPSFEFTSKVMDRVLVEAKKTPLEYHPLISRQMWLRISVGMILLFIGIALLRTYFPGNENPAGWQSLYRFDLSVVFGPFLNLFREAKIFSVSFAGGLMAFSLLLLADRIYSRHT